MNLKNNDECHVNKVILLRLLYVLRRIRVPACVDKDGGVFHLGEEVFVADLLRFRR